MIQAKELEELRQTVFRSSNGHTVCQHYKCCGTASNDNPSLILFPASSTSESYFSIDEEEAERPNNSGQINKLQRHDDHGDNRREIYMSESLSVQSEDPDPEWNVEYNRETEAESGAHSHPKQRQNLRDV